MDTYKCADGVEVVRDRGTVTFERPRPGIELKETRLEMPGHVLDDTLLDWALRHTNDASHATVGGRVRAAVDVATFLMQHGARTLNAEVYSAYLTHLRTARIRTRNGGTLKVIGESLQRQRAQKSKSIYEWGLGARPALGWVQRDLDSMEVAYARAFEGFHVRQIKEGQEKALTTDEFNRVLRACRRELHACEQRVADWETAGSPAADVLALNRGQKGTQRVMIPNPFVVFYVLAALDASMRAEEFNTLSVGAFVGDRLRVHGPKHEARELVLDDHVARALQVCLTYSGQIRPFSKDPDALLVFACDDVESSRRNRGVLRVKSGDVCRWLPAFVARYSDLLYEDPRADTADLARPDSPGGAERRPLTLTPRLLRNDGLSQFALVERNLDVVRRHAQNKKEQTLERHYIRQREEERLASSAKHLAGLAERIRMVAQSRVVAEPNAVEAERLAGAGALVPVGFGTTIGLGGHCQEAANSAEAAALAAGYRPGCVRSRDCRLCENFRIYPSRREVYVVSCARKLEKATKIATDEGNLREAENLRRSAVLDQAIVDGIDAYLNCED